MTSYESSRKLEKFVNEHLKEDLAEYEKQLNTINAEILEFIQLKNMIESIKDNFQDELKSQVNIGGNLFMQAKVSQPEHILVNVGCNCYVEFKLDEAIKFADFKTRLLKKHADIVRQESIKTKANIKLALMCIGETTQLTGIRHD